MIKTGFIILMAIFFTLFLNTVFYKSRALPFKFSMKELNFEDTTYINIAGKNIKAEIVDSDEERNKGLGGRKSIGKDEGMLFIFPTPANYSFWMKDMRFPIDIIWIDENKKISAISENVSPDTYPTSFSSSEPVKYVLEVNAGWVDRNGLKMGEKVEF